MMPPPLILSIITCDKTIRDMQTFKISLIDCFSTFSISSVPFTVHQFSLYVQMTDGSGIVPITVQIKNLTNNELILKEDCIKIEFKDSITPFEFVLTLNGVTFPNYGSYAIEIYTNKEFLGSAKIIVSKPPKKDNL
jgi:hypothetical protein